MRLRPVLNSGFSLVEILVAVGILSAVMMASVNYFRGQMKANNFLEYQSKKEELRLAIIGQFLKTPENCGCLFSAIPPFSTPGPTTINANPNKKIGLYSFVAPGVCGSATVPFPFDIQIGHISVTSVSLGNVVLVGTNYSGELDVVVTATKEITGSPLATIRVPVAINATAVGPNLARIDGCSTAAGTGVIPGVGLCPAGQFATGYDPTGVLQCGPPTYQ